MDTTEKKYTLYVGSNNETKELEKELIIGIVAKWYKSFTAYEVNGYWIGEPERSLKIEIYTNGDDINEYSITKLTEELERECKQDKVLRVTNIIKTNF